MPGPDLLECCVSWCLVKGGPTLMLHVGGSTSFWEWSEFLSFWISRCSLYL